jgi:hypothetical protein
VERNAEDGTGSGRAKRFIKIGARGRKFDMKIVAEG